MKRNNRVEEIYQRGIEALESFYSEKKPRTGKKKKEVEEQPQSKEYDTVNEQEV